MSPLGGTEPVAERLWHFGPLYAIRRYWLCCYELSAKRHFPYETNAKAPDSPIHATGSSSLIRIAM